VIIINFARHETSLQSREKKEGTTQGARRKGKRERERERREEKERYIGSLCCLWCFCERERELNSIFFFFPFCQIRERREARVPAGSGKKRCLLTNARHRK
jgi:hypothetical protein